MTTAESQRDSDAGVPIVEDSVDPRPAVRDLPARGRCVLVAQGRGGRRQVQAGNLELHEEDVRGAVRSHHAHARSSSPPVGADASASLRCLTPPVLRLGKSPPLGCPGPPSASGRPTPSGGWPGLSMNGRSVPSEVQALGYVPSAPRTPRSGSLPTLFGRPGETADPEPIRLTARLLSAARVRISSALRSRGPPAGQRAARTAATARAASDV